MTTTFPGAVDTLLNPSTSDTLNSATAGLKHATQHTNANDAIEAIEGYLISGGIPAVRVFGTANVGIGSGVATSLSFTSESYDTATLHSTVSFPTRLTASAAGKYRMLGTVAWASGVASWRELTIRLNGATVIGDHYKYHGATSSVIMQVHAEYELAIGDYIELLVYQDTGGSLNVSFQSGLSPTFGMARIA